MESQVLSRLDWVGFNSYLCKTLVLELDHKELVLAAAEGDSEAQRRLYNLYAKQMFSVAFRLLNHREDAEDVLQESFIAAFEALRNYRNEASFGSWLKRIVVNKSLNHLKKKKLVLEDIKDQWEEEVTIDAKELTVEMIKQTLAEMPDGYRLVFSLYYFENMAHKEIAEHLNISEGGSKSQLNRAKQRLKQKLEPLGYGK